jgi:hypothetical protein
MDDPRAELAQVLALSREIERKLGVASLIDELVRDLGFRAIVIGGVAVEFWTHGAYSTTDLDLYLPHGPAVDDRLALLGFARPGRHWVHPEHDLFVEAPASFPAPNEEVTEIELSDGRKALVLSPEDVLIYRLHEFVATGHPDVGEQSIALLAAPDLDRSRLVRRAEEERLSNAVDTVELLKRRLERGETIEPYEFHDAARKLT